MHKIYTFVSKKIPGYLWVNYFWNYFLQLVFPADIVILSFLLKMTYFCMAILAFWQFCNSTAIKCTSNPNQTGMDQTDIPLFRSSHPEVFLWKSVVKICSKFTGEHPYRSAISMKLLCNFIEIAPRHGCSPLNLLYIFRTTFPKNTSGPLLVPLSIFCFLTF